MVAENSSNVFLNFQILLWSETGNVCNEDKRSYFSRAEICCFFEVYDNEKKFILILAKRR